MSAVPHATDGLFCDHASLPVANGQVWDGLFCVGVIIAEGEADFGGSQFPDKKKNPFVVFKPITEPLKGEMPVDAKYMSYIGDSENEVEIDGKSYTIVEARTPSEIISEAENLNEILDEAVDKLGVSRRKAKKALFDEVIKELKKVEKVKQSVFNDDEEIIMILVATDDL